MIFFDIEARNKMKKGVDTLANAVKVTQAPKAATWLLKRNLAHRR
jgi:chaperonin GroEL